MAQEQPRKGSDSMSQLSETASHTAQEYIASQLQLEAEAREALPYQFDACTRPLGPLRQSLFSCLTCNPPPESPDAPYTPAGLCYSCSISCHGEHTLVELFSKRNFVCDCGSTRLPSSSPCNLRHNEATGRKGGVTGDEARDENKYNPNFAGHFCACGDTYDPTKEKGTMFQCLGLGTVKHGGCGEDWWHPECLMGLPRIRYESREHVEQEGEVQEDDAPLPPGFPIEDDFDHVICYKCVDSHSWLKPYAATQGFLDPVYRQSSDSAQDSTEGVLQDAATMQPSAAAKRKAEDNDDEASESKRVKVESGHAPVTNGTSLGSVPDGSDDTPKPPLHASLPRGPSGVFSIFVKGDFRDRFCRCSECFPRLSRHSQLLEEEEAYEPPVSESDAHEANGGGSVGTGSMLERGEAALSAMDRMQAIEGVMAYNHLRDKVKTFLQPFAESGQAVGAEDVKAYFAKLRGDEEAMRLAAASADGGGETSGNRREQSGY